MSGCYSIESGEFKAEKVDRHASISLVDEMSFFYYKLLVEKLAFSIYNIIY